MDFLKQNFALILTGVMTLVGVIIGFLLDRMSKRFDERKKMKSELNSLKTAITVACTNLLRTQEMINLKKYYIKYADFSQHKVNKEFYEKWFSKNPFFDDIFLHENLQLPFTEPEIESLNYEVSKLRV